MNTDLLRRCASSALTALVVAVLGGCAQPVRSTALGGTMYPAAPATPRVQFLTCFSGAADLRDDGGHSTLSTLFFGTPTTSDSRLTKPAGMAMHDGRLYVCDSAEAEIFVFDFASGQCRTWNHGDVALHKPVSIRFRDDGDVEICDAGLNRVLLFSSDGTLLASIGLDTLRQADDTSASRPAFKPLATVAGPDGRTFVLDVASHRVDLVDLREGALFGSWSGPGSEAGRLFLPTAMAPTSDGLIVSDLMNRRLTRFAADGSVQAVIGEPGDAPGYIAHPKGVAVDEAGVVYVSDGALQIVQMFDGQGEFLMSFGGADIADGGLGAPAGLCLDRTCMPYFEKFLKPGFAPEYLIFVSNQVGPSRISVYAFGQGPAQPVSAG